MKKTQVTRKSARTRTLNAASGTKTGTGARRNRTTPDPALLDLQVAADKARDGFENQAAIDLYTRAIEQLDAGTPAASHSRRVSATLYDLLAGRSECDWRIGNLAAPAADLQEMARLAQELGDTGRQIEVLLRQVELTNQKGKPAQAERYARTAVRLARESRDRKREADSLRALGAAYAFAGVFPQARKYGEEALRIHKELADRAGVASDLQLLGRADSATGKSDAARNYFEEALAIARTMGDRQREAEALNGLGTAAPDLAQKRGYYEQALALSLTMGVRLTQARLYNNLGLLYWGLGLYGKARDFGEEATRIARDIEARGNLAYILESLARSYLDSGGYEQAERMLEEGVSLAQEVSDRSNEAGFVFGLGRLALARQEPSRALGRLERASELFEELGMPVERASTLASLGAAHLALGDWKSADRCTSQAVGLLESLSDYSGEYLPQEVWWWRYRVLKAQDGKIGKRAREKGRHGATEMVAASPRPGVPASSEAWACLDRAHALMLGVIATLSDEGLRRNYLNKVKINRKITLEWAEQAALRGLAPGPATSARAGNLQEQLRRVMEIGVRMNEQRDPEALLNFIMDEAVELNGAERSILLSIDANGRADLRVAKGVPAEELEQVKTQALALLDRVAQSRQGELISDAETGGPGDPRTARAGTETVPASSTPRVAASILAVPLISGGKLTGLLYADNRVIFGEFDRTDLDLLSVFANQAATAIENARLYHGLEQRVAERTAELQTSNAALEQRKVELEIINGMQKALASQLDMQGIYDLVGDKIREIFDAQAVTISTFDKASGINHLRYMIEKGRRYYPDPVPLGPIGQEQIRTRQPLLFTTAKQFVEMGVGTVPGSEPSLSGLFVPLIVGDEVKGGISLQNVERENAFGESDVRLLSTLAS